MSGSHPHMALGVMFALILLIVGSASFGAGEDASQCRTDAEDSDDADILRSGNCIDHEGRYQGFCIRYDYNDLCLGSWLYEFQARGGTCSGFWMDCHALDYALCHEGARYKVTYACVADEVGAYCRPDPPAKVEDCAPYGCEAAHCQRTCRTGSDCTPPHTCVGGSCQAGCTPADNGAWVDTDGDEEHEDVCCNRISISATLYGSYYVEGFTKASPMSVKNTDVELVVLTRDGSDVLGEASTTTDSEGRLTFTPMPCLSPGVYLLRITLPRSQTTSSKLMTVTAEGGIVRVSLSPG